MLYRAIGMMSGSSLDGLDIVFAELLEESGIWKFEILNSACYTYSPEMRNRLAGAVNLSALDYQLLHTEYGHHIGGEVNRFIEENQLHFRVGLIASHGHTTFHIPGKKMTAQLGDGAAIAAATALPVVSDLRALDVAFGGEGAPIVPIGEKLLFPDHDLFLNIGGIANISITTQTERVAFDVCAANRVLNELSLRAGKSFDAGGEMAASGRMNNALLDRLNTLDYYHRPSPKSLANRFGLEVVLPIIDAFALSVPDALNTYVEHIAIQLARALQGKVDRGSKMLVTGGGAFNTFLTNRIAMQLRETGIELMIPSPEIIAYKEALIMALIGVLRWRQEYNVLSSVTGASRDSIGGAVWIGQEA